MDAFFGFIIIVAIVWIIVATNKKKVNQQKQTTDYFSAATYTLNKENKHKSEAFKNRISKSESPETSQVTLDLSFEDSETKIPKYLVFDCETTGLPKSRNGSIDDLSIWPYIVQIAWAVFDEFGKSISINQSIVKQKVHIPYEATRIHGITDEIMKDKGVPPVEIFNSIARDMMKVEILIAHNITFDFPILAAEFKRNKIASNIYNCFQICTMRSSTQFCGLTKSNGAIKFPKLSELTGCLFYGNPYISIKESHNAYYDVLITAKCFFKLYDLGQLSINESKQMTDDYETVPVQTEEVTIPEKPDFGRVNVKNISDDQLRLSYNRARRDYNSYWRSAYGTDEKPTNIFGERRKILLFHLQQSENNLRHVISKIQEHHIQ